MFNLVMLMSFTGDCSPPLDFSLFPCLFLSFVFFSLPFLFVALMGTIKRSRSNFHSVVVVGLLGAQRLEDVWAVKQRLFVVCCSRPPFVPSHHCSKFTLLYSHTLTLTTAHPLIALEQHPSAWAVRWSVRLVGCLLALLTS